MEISQLALSSFLLHYYLKIFHWKYFAGIWLIWIHVFTFGLVLYSMKKALNSLLNTVTQTVIYSIILLFRFSNDESSEDYKLAGIRCRMLSKKLKEAGSVTKILIPLLSMSEGKHSMYDRNTFNIFLRPQLSNRK